MAHEGSPTYEIRQGIHGFAFPDGTRVDVHQPQRDRVGRLWAEVTAKVGARVLNRARFDLLDLQARERFHRATVGLDEGIDWQARLLFALEHVVRTLEDAQADTEAEEPPAPLTDAVEPFPVEVFPTPLARFVQEAASALPCPPDFIGVLMLPLLSAAIGTSRVLEVKPGWHEGPRIYAAVVAEPGSKKSPALDLVMTPYRQRQHTLHTTYLHDTAQYQRALDQYEDDLADWKQRRGIGSSGSCWDIPWRPFATMRSRRAGGALMALPRRARGSDTRPVHGLVAAWTRRKPLALVQSHLPVTRAASAGDARLWTARTGCRHHASLP